DAVAYGHDDVPREGRPVVREPAVRLRGRRAVVSVGPPAVRLPVRMADLRTAVRDRKVVRPPEAPDEAVPQRLSVPVLRAVRHGVGGDVGPDLQLGGAKLTVSRMIDGNRLQN